MVDHEMGKFAKLLTFVVYSLMGSTLFAQTELEVPDPLGVFPDASLEIESGVEGKTAVPESELGTPEKAEATPKKAAPADTSTPSKPSAYTIGSAPELSAKVNNGGLQFETANSDYRFHLGALIQQDYVFFDQDAELEAPPGTGPGPSGGVGELQDGVFFRRGRIRFDGIAHELVEWDFDCELIANNTVAFDDLWVGLTQLPIVGNVRAGHVKIPMGIESMTSNRTFTFVERAALFDAFLPEYGPGILAFDSYRDGKLTWAACAHRLDPLNNGTDTGDGQWNGTFRLSSLAYNSSDDRHYLHLGSAYSIRDDRAGSVRFRARPEWRDTTNVASLNNRFVDTGEIAADGFDLYQAEMAWVAGAFSAQTEYLYANVDANNRDQGFHGGYAMASYFLTGESRPYDKRMGRFARLKPIENFVLTRTSSGSPKGVGALGTGAWELAARYSWVDLSSEDITGGVQESITAGVNWYWNYNFRIQANYLHTLRDADAPTSISGSVDAFVMRMSFDI
jgi:phosphate-selective porin OprO and OprP